MMNFLFLEISEYYPFFRDSNRWGLGGSAPPPSPNFGNRNHVKKTSFMLLGTENSKSIFILPKYYDSNDKLKYHNCYN